MIRGNSVAIAPTWCSMGSCDNPNSYIERLDVPLPAYPFCPCANDSISKRSVGTWKLISRFDVDARAVFSLGSTY